MKTEKIEERDINGQEEAVPFRDRVFEPDELIPMLLELMTYEPKLYDCREMKPKPEKDLFKKRGALQTRYEQAVAILKAYGLFAGLNPRHPIRSFVEGDFIENEPAIDNEAMEQAIRECLNELDTDEIISTRPFDKRMLQSNNQEFFSGIFSYLIGLRNATEYLDGYLMMGAGTSRALRVINQLSMKYTFPQIALLHETLMLYIRQDTVKPYTFGELIDNYGYRELTEEELLGLMF